MKTLTGAAVLVAATLALSACASSQRVIYNVGPDLVHITLPPPLWKPIRAEARSMARSLGDPSVKTAQVYGPDSRYLLVKASSGDLVQKIARERKGFYLIVLHGHFVCHGCSRPHGSTAKPPRGKIATEVWSPKTGQTDFGLGNRPEAMSHLRGPTVITLGWRNRKQGSAYAYELPIDPSHPKRGQWSTLVRTHPVTVGYRLRGIFPREWVVGAVRPMPQDGQQAAVRGWRGRKNPIWHGRLVLRLAAGASTLPYDVVAHLAGRPIKAPTKSQAWGACPGGALPLNSVEMRSAKRVVLAALPTLGRRATPHLRLKNARVTLVSHTRRSGFIMPTRRVCWGRPFSRSVLVEVFLPAERSAALRGNPWFYVARTRNAWVIWDEPH